MIGDATDWGDDWLRDAAADTRRDAERRYTESDRFIADALMWVGDHGHEHATVVAVACAAYRESDEYDTRIDDLLDGEVTL